MEFSRDWLSQYVDLPSTEELSRGLTQVGLALLGPFAVLILGWVIFRTAKPRIPDYI